jgi:hypothetical protein
VSARERRQVDLFVADLFGAPVTRLRGSIRPAPWMGRQVFADAASDFAEDAPVELRMRSGGTVGNTSSVTNVREDVLNALDRLHVLWSITNDDYGAEYRRVAALPEGSPISGADANLPKLIAAIHKNEVPHLHNKVMRNFFEIDVTAPVGSRQTNNTADVRKLQVVLVALGLLPAGAAVEGNPSSSGSIPDAALPQTLNAIREVKARIAEGRLGWDPIHADELETGGDRFGGRTYEWSNLSIFVPRGTSGDRNDVHVFFSAGGVQGNSGLNGVLHHGLRAASEGTGWILIGVPGAEPGFVTIDTAQIEGALRRIGRGTNIGRLRLSAHSRGGRGLRETIAGRLVDISRIDRVVILDCGWSSVASALSAARIPRSKVIGYQVNDAALPATVGRTIRIDPECARAIGYSRLIQDATRTRPSLVIPPQVQRQLLALPSRGTLKAASAVAGSTDSLDAFCATNRARIAAIVRDEASRPHGLKTFLDANDLGRLGMVFKAGIYSHHFFVAEIAHEITS